MVYSGTKWRYLWLALLAGTSMLNVPRSALANKPTAVEVAATIVGDDPDAARLAIYGIQNQQWGGRDAEVLGKSLIVAFKMGRAREGVAASVSLLAISHPDEMQSAVSCLIQSIDLGSLKKKLISQGEARHITRSLGSLGALATDAVLPLRRIFESEKEFPYVCASAAVALMNIDGPDEHIVSWLRSRLSTEWRHVTLAALAAAGCNGVSLVPELVDMMSDNVAVTRVLAANALWQIENRVRPEVIVVLCSAIQKEPEEFALEPFGPSPPPFDTVSTAAASLRKMGAKGGGAIPELTRIAENGDMYQRHLATYVLSAIQSDERP